MNESKTTRARASDELKREFSVRLAAKLREKQINQSELAKLIGMSKDAVSTYARARSIPNEATLKKICKALDVKPEELLPVRFDLISAVSEQTTLTVLGDGMARLFLNTVIPLELATQILELAHGQTDNAD